MKDFKLRDLIEAFGTKKEKDFFLNCDDTLYIQLDDVVCDICSDIKDMINSRMSK